ncbi:hypothetical protein [Sphingomicrobium astaxanthinifaciens]|uniref:hypothetical protein n=1 Tax=Sphingomicrobium astaxanthinifaciens TaxID=1227949 RepID=UPI001FCAB1F5|nr:hypothetical protein [Sphingomicrobium astaxanthinifaciens]MCJ7421297.1 hypothetical protein [Sphingomicrobium astaxanthinifaciens]
MLAEPAAPPPPGWWERGWFLAFLLVAALVPFATTGLPPLADLPGHYARAAVAAGIEHVPAWQERFTYRWILVPNLGVDVPVALLAPLTGVKLAMKLVVMAIPPLTILGFWTLAKAATGRVPPTFAATVALAFSHPFLFGFVNFSFAVALALFVLALWIRLGKEDRFLLRAALVVPFGSLVYFAHAFSWGLLGLAAYAAELVRWRQRGEGLPRTVLMATVSIWPLMLPSLHLGGWMVQRGIEGAAAAPTSNWVLKANWLLATLRDGERWADTLPIAVIATMIGALLTGWVRVASKALGAGAVLLLLAFLGMPGTVAGSAFADMRMAPLLFALALLALDGTSQGARRWLAAAALGIALYKLGLVTHSSRFWDAAIEERLAVLEAVPQGAAVYMLHGPTQCFDQWSLRRTTHLGGYVIADKQGFSNNSWALGSASPLRLRDPLASGHDRDPSQLSRLDNCGPLHFPQFFDVLERFPREHYEYLWLVDAPMPPGYNEFELVAANRGAMLYRIKR